ncbi:MAG: cysteine desulfurase [Chloroflexi bacterium]|nr:cysteine desulfurase [Chloroflexota bacterium]
MQQNGVYLDYAASTPIDERVLEAMLPYFTTEFGNPSSIHRWGQRAETAVEDARESIAAIMDCAPEEIVFTSCGSESDNLAVRGLAMYAKNTRGARHILISPVEHDAVSKTAHNLAERFGFDLEFLPVDEDGRVSPNDLAIRIRDDTALVSIIYANNEIGTINPIAELADICRRREIPFHTDAVQAASQLDITVNHLNIDLLSLGAHKFYGPKGVGALYIRSGNTIWAQQTGGSQEFSLRAGTQNVPLIVGMARALEITQSESDEHNKKYSRLRDHLLGALPEIIPDTQISGHLSSRLPNHASFLFKGIDGNQLLGVLDAAGFGCSSGSACKTGDPAPSKVLEAIGLPAIWALGSLRVTVGRPTREADIQRLVQILPEAVERLRKISA